MRLIICCFWQTRIVTLYWQHSTCLTFRRKTKEFDIITLCANAFVILVAGYDTTGQTLGFVAYLLAKHPDIQERLRDEVDKGYDENGGQMPQYAAIQGGNSIMGLPAGGERRHLVARWNYKTRFKVAGYKAKSDVK